MFLKFKPCVIALCSFLIMTSVAAQSDDSTNLKKMQKSDFKAMDGASSVIVLTKGNLQKTFKGLKATVANSGSYKPYQEKLRYEVIESSGNLAIKKYTPLRSCSSFGHKAYGKGKKLCLAENQNKGGRSSIVCVIPQGAKLCKGSSYGSSYELTLSGLLMAEARITCWYLPYPLSSYDCGYRLPNPSVYMWDASLAEK